MENKQLQNVRIVLSELTNTLYIATKKDKRELTSNELDLVKYKLKNDKSLQQEDSKELWCFYCWEKECDCDKLEATERDIADSKIEPKVYDEWIEKAYLMFASPRIKENPNFRNNLSYKEFKQAILSNLPKQRDKEVDKYKIAKEIYDEWNESQYPKDYLDDDFIYWIDWLDEKVRQRQNR